MDPTKWAMPKDLLFGILEVLRIVLAHDPTELQWKNNPMAHQLYLEGEKQKANGEETSLHEMIAIDEAHVGIPNDLTKADKKDDAIEKESQDRDTVVPSQMD